MALHPLFRLGAVNAPVAGFHGLLGFWSGGAGIESGAVVEVEAPRRGAFYPTPEEIEELLREQRKRDKLKKEQEVKQETELAELYDEIKDPALRKRKILLAQEVDDEEALLMIFMYLDDDDDEIE